MSKQNWDKVMSLKKNALLQLGPYFTDQMLNSPRHFLFTLARYKFAARMLPRKPGISVLELGCNEGIGTLLLKEKADKVVGVDFDETAVARACKSLKSSGITFLHSDFLGKQFGSFDCVVSLDVAEHISRANEKGYFKTILDNLTASGLCILGTPNDSASQFASAESKKGHVNLFTATRLYDKMASLFQQVFLFGMNDEVLHTGFDPMCHYLLAIGCNPKITA